MKIVSKRVRSTVCSANRKRSKVCSPGATLTTSARCIATRSGYSSRSWLRTRTRASRDHMKYLTLIRTIALLHQHQRERKTIVHNGETIEYIEVTRSDIDLANRLAHEVLGRSLDELPPQTRRLLTLVDQMVSTECERLAIDRSEYHFTRRHAREVTGWGETQLRIHLDRLVALEYLLVHRGGRGQSFVYELLYNAAADRRPSVLADATTAQTSRGEEGKFAGGTRPQSGPVAATSRPTSRRGKASADAASGDITVQTVQNAHLERTPKTKSYRLRRGNGRDHAQGSV